MISEQWTFRKAKSGIECTTDLSFVGSVIQRGVVLHPTDRLKNDALLASSALKRKLRCQDRKK
ncbi:MAG: hypothetical protein WBJ46_07340 [Rectinema sp.]